MKLSDLKQNWIGATFGGVAGFLLAKKYISGGLIVPVFAAITGIVIGSSTQKNFFSKSTAGKSKIVVKQEDATK